MNRRGIVLLELTIALMIGIMCTYECVSLYTRFVRTKEKMFRHYERMFSSKTRLIRAYSGVSGEEGLQRQPVAPGIYRLTDPVSGLWVHVYEE